MSWVREIRRRVLAGGMLLPLALLVLLVLGGGAPAHAETATGTIPTGTTPYAVAVNPVTNQVYVANYDSHTVTVIDGATNTATEIAGLFTPAAVAVNPVTNKVYVANEWDSRVTVIDGATHTTESVALFDAPGALAVNPVTNKTYVAHLGGGRIDGDNNLKEWLTTAESPLAVAVNPVTNKVYVTTVGPSTIRVVNGETDTQEATVPIGGSNPVPVALAVNPVTDQVYVATAPGNSVAVLDGATNALTLVPVGTNPTALAVNPVTNQIFVANTDDGTVTVIDGATNTATGTITVGTAPVAVAVNPVTNKVYVANQGSNNVTVIDGATGDTTAVAAGSGPFALGVNPVTNRVYVANRDSGDVTVIDGATNQTTTVAAGQGTAAGAVNPVTNRVYVANPSSHEVTVLDGATHTTTATLAVGTTPVAVDVNPRTNRIYVANRDSDEVSVIDGSNNTTTTVAAGDSPMDVAVNPVTNQIYVANAGSQDVTIIDGATGDTTTVAAGALPFDLEANPVTNRIYVANKAGGTVTVIDGTTRTTTTVAVGTDPTALAVNPVTNQVYVANQGSDTVTVIDGATQTTVTVGVGTAPLAVAVNPVTNRIYVANHDSNNITVIDGATNTPIAAVSAGTHPIALAVDAVTNKIYVSNQGSDNVTIIDGVSHTTTTVAAGTSPGAVFLNPVTQRVYVPNQGSHNLTIIAGQEMQEIPLTTTVTPLPGDWTTNPTPTFTLTATSGYTPTAPPVQQVYYQFDTWQGQWQQATPDGAGFTAVPGAALAPGSHLLFAFAGDGMEATSIMTGAQSSPVPGAVTAYLFHVLPAPTRLAVTAVNGGASPVAGTPFAVEVTAVDQEGVLAPVSADTTITLSLTGGTGTLGGNLTGVIPAGSPRVTISGVSYTRAESGVVLQATASGGDPLTVGESSPLTVLPGPAAGLALSTEHAGTETAGTPFSVTLTARDAYGNTATGYEGDHAITWTWTATSSPDGTAPVRPADGTVTFTAGVATVGGFTLTNAGESPIITATDDGSLTGTSGAITVSPGPAADFVVTAPATATAGTPFSVDLTARDAYGNTATGYTGTRTLSYTGPGDGPTAGTPTYTTTATFTDGVATGLSTTLVRAETTSLTVSEGSLTGTSGAITVSPGPAAGFVVTAPATATAGTAFTVDLTAQDAYGNTATGYTGNKTLTYTGPGNAPTADSPVYTQFATFVDGVATGLSTILVRAETTSLTVTEGSLTGTSGPITVSPGPAVVMWIVPPPTATAGTPFSVTLMVLDDYGNTVTGYEGDHTITWTWTATGSPNGTPPVRPADGTVTFTAGVATVGGFTLTNAGETPTLAATDEGGLFGPNRPITVIPGPAADFVVTAPATATAGTAFTVDLTAQDAYGNTATGYTGNKTLTYTGPGDGPTAGSPTYTTAATFVDGVATGLSTTLVRAETTSLTVSEGGVTGTSGAITVSPGPAAGLAVSAPATATAGTPFSVTLTARDAYGNTATGYEGDHAITWGWTATGSPDGTAPVRPADGTVTFTAGVATVGGFTLTNAGESPTITATDDGSLTGTSGAITVSPGLTSATESTVAAAPASVPANGSATATITVTLQDSYGNPVGGKAVTLTQDGSSTISAASGPSSAAGQVTFTVSHTQAGTVTYTAADATDGVTLAQTAQVTFTRSSAGGREKTPPATPGVVIDPTQLTLSEGGPDGSYTVVLTSQPLARVTVNITGDGQVAVTPAALTFTPENWNVPQTVTVTAVDDAVVEGTHSGMVSHTVTSADSAYRGMAVAGVAVQVTDNDQAAVPPEEAGAGAGGAAGGSEGTTGGAGAGAGGSEGATGGAGAGAGGAGGATGPTCGEIVGTCIPLPQPGGDAICLEVLAGLENTLTAAAAGARLTPIPAAELEQMLRGATLPPGFQTAIRGFVFDPGPLPEGTGTAAAPALPQPVTVVIPLTAADHQATTSPERLGLFGLTVEGSLTFMGGRLVEGDRLAATLDGPGVYLLAEVNRSFTDLTGHWARGDVEFMAAKYVVQGFPDGRFLPEGTLTRAQFAAMLVRATGILPGVRPASQVAGWAANGQVTDGQAGGEATGGVPGSPPAGFSDVQPGDWFYEEVMAAVAAGIARGYEDGTFRPDDPVTREQMAVMVARALQMRCQATALTSAEAEQLLAAFADAGSVSAWAGTDLALAVQEGILKGKGAENIAPGAYATRAEAAAMLARFWRK